MWPERTTNVQIYRIEVILESNIPPERSCSNFAQLYFKDSGKNSIYGSSKVRLSLQYCTVHIQILERYEFDDMLREVTFFRDF